MVLGQQLHRPRLPAVGQIFNDVAEDVRILVHPQNGQAPALVLQPLPSSGKYAAAGLQAA